MHIPWVGGFEVQITKVLAQISLLFYIQQSFQNAGGLLHEITPSVTNEVQNAQCQEYLNRLHGRKRAPIGCTLSVKQCPLERNLMSLLDDSHSFPIHYCPTSSRLLSHLHSISINRPLVPHAPVLNEILVSSVMCVWERESQ